jgi:hypothetical protein
VSTTTYRPGGAAIQQEDGEYWWAVTAYIVDGAVDR